MRTASVSLFATCAALGIVWWPVKHSASGEATQKKSSGLTLVRDGHWLIIRGNVPGEIRIIYLEAYCRAGSTDADWVKHTTLPHRSELIAMSPDGKELKLRDTLEDGNLIVNHTITAGEDTVEFKLEAENKGRKLSEAHWAQPCVRLSKFLGMEEATAGNATDYLANSFIYLNGKMTSMPTQPWATEARYIPGQTWCPTHVPRTDVNPRPLSSLVPSNGLIGSFTPDKRWILATAWEPYQELFQGIARCLHSDFRLGGLKPGEKKQIRGKIYVIQGEEKVLRERYETDFPEHLHK